MDEPTLRKWHRRVGVGIGALVLLQAVSGLFLSVEWLLGFHARVGALIDASRVPESLKIWDWLFVNVHYGGGPLGAMYHTALALGLIWLVITGFSINDRVRQRLRRRKEKQAAGP